MARTSRSTILSDATPTHSYLKCSINIPKASFLTSGWWKRTAYADRDPEFELIDTGIFDDDRYFDVFVEYAKGWPDDILIRIVVIIAGPKPQKFT